MAAAPTATAIAIPAECRKCYLKTDDSNNLARDKISDHIATP
jgi:hypothetical protein